MEVWPTSSTLGAPFAPNFSWEINSSIHRCNLMNSSPAAPNSKWWFHKLETSSKTLRLYRLPRNIHLRTLRTSNRIEMSITGRKTNMVRRRSFKAPAWDNLPLSKNKKFSTTLPRPVEPIENSSRSWVSSSTTQSCARWSLSMRSSWSVSLPWMSCVLKICCPFWRPLKLRCTRILGSKRNRVTLLREEDWLLRETNFKQLFTKRT